MSLWILRPIVNFNPQILYSNILTGFIDGGGSFQIKILIVHKIEFD